MICSPSRRLYRMSPRWVSGNDLRRVHCIMSLTFPPRPRSVLMCDFVGYIVPEIVKVRPVIVLVKHRYNRQLVTVVPLSTTQPDRLGDHHHQLAVNPLPDKPHTSCWAKCDMVATVALARLDRYKVGVGRFVVPEVSMADFNAIRAGVASALGLMDNGGVPKGICETAYPPRR